jgi:hypothetical protein
LATSTLELPITPEVPLMMYPPSLVCWTLRAAAKGAEPNCCCHCSAPEELSLAIQADSVPLLSVVLPATM